MLPCVVADNVLSLDNGESLRPYLSRVRDPLGPYSSSRSFLTPMEYTADSEKHPDAVEISTFRGLRPQS